MSKKTNLKKIIWIHSHFLYWMGGTKYIYEVIKRLKKYFDIIVFVENSSNIADKYYKKINVPVISMRKSSSTSSLYWLTLPFQLKSETKYLKKIIKEKGYKKKNTVIITSMFPMNVVAQNLDIKRVQYCFEPFAFFYDEEFIKKFSLPKKLFIWLLSHSYKSLDIDATKSADGVITLNNTTANQIKKIYNIKPAISYTGIDSKHFKPYTGKKILEKYKSKKVIIHSTDYSPVKNTDLMIEIFAKVNKKIKDSHLLITSTIKDEFTENKLKSLVKNLGISKSVEFLGFIDYDLLPQYYSLAKVLVQTSFSEKSGTTSMALPVKEAMACGTPAIRYPFRNEDVIDGKSGFLIDPRDKEKMVEKIVYLLKLKKERYSEFAKISRNSIISRYKWENTAKIIANQINMN